ncbi:PRC-barrel domain-containing protein [Wenxinia saemankumensis]|uniref:PRC-barrel domain-containing protein n=1 Tax=Wenxinia saemankumensis TaxID=1447782 RepID=A0A1M6AVR2_9RHOB|nr:PRC-barrel domain-containing protein [Wenxinia saemankumensis]SHI40323.1 PRC-barrel domain-containing protein [Wenxinia saemankumensis]
MTSTDVDTGGRAPNSLVPSTAVDGTDVYSPNGDKVGHIDHLMIDKQSGNVAYAVMHFGGFLGMGEEEQTIPWRKLSYDTSRDGFVTDITKEQLDTAPARGDSGVADRDYEMRLHDYYGMNPYWI